MIESIFVGILTSLASSCILAFGKKALAGIFGTQVVSKVDLRDHSLAEGVLLYEKKLLADGLSPEEAQSKAEEMRQKGLEFFVSDSNHWPSEWNSRFRGGGTTSLFEKLLSIYVLSKGVITPDFFDVSNEESFAPLVKRLASSIENGVSLSVLSANREEAALWVGVMLCKKFGMRPENVVWINKKKDFEEYIAKPNERPKESAVLCLADDIDEYFEEGVVFVSDNLAVPQSSDVLILPRRPRKAFSDHWVDKRFTLDEKEQYRVSKLAPDWAAWKRKFLIKNPSPPSWVSLAPKKLLLALAISAPFSEKDFQAIGEAFSLNSGEIEGFIEEDQRSAERFLYEKDIYGRRSYRLATPDSLDFVAPYASYFINQIRKLANLVFSGGEANSKIAVSLAENLSFLYFRSNGRDPRALKSAIEDIARWFFSLASSNPELLSAFRSCLFPFANIAQEEFLDKAGTMCAELSRSNLCEYDKELAFGSIASALQVLFWYPRSRERAFREIVNLGDSWQTPKRNPFSDAAWSGLLWWYAYFNLSLSDKESFMDILSEKDSDWRWNLLLDNSRIGGAPSIFVSRIASDPGLLDANQGKKFDPSSAIGLPVRSFVLATEMAGKRLDRWWRLLEFGSVFDYPESAVNAFCSALKNAAVSFGRSELIYLKSAIFESVRAMGARLREEDFSPLVKPRLKRLLDCLPAEFTDAKLFRLYGKSFCLLHDFDLEGSAPPSSRIPDSAELEEQIKRIFPSESSDPSEALTLIIDVLKTDDELAGLCEKLPGVSPRLDALVSLFVLSKINIEKSVLQLIAPHRLGTKLVERLLRYYGHNLIPSSKAADLYEWLLEIVPEDSNLIALACVFDASPAHLGLVSKAPKPIQKAFFESGFFKKPPTDDERDFVMRKLLEFSLWDQAIQFVCQFPAESLTLSVLKLAVHALVEECSARRGDLETEFALVKSALKRDMPRCDLEMIGEMAKAEFVLRDREQFFTGRYFFERPEWLAVALGTKTTGMEPADSFQAFLLANSFSYSFSHRIGAKVIYALFTSQSEFDEWVNRAVGHMVDESQDQKDSSLAILFTEIADNQYRFPPFAKSYINRYCFRNLDSFVGEAIVCFRNKRGFYSVGCGESSISLSKTFSSLAKEEEIGVVKRIYESLSAEYSCDAVIEERGITD